MTTTGYATTVRGDTATAPAEAVVLPGRHSASWGAIWAGLFVTLGVEILLTMLMVGVFAAALPAGGAGTSWGWDAGIGVWWFLQTIAAFYCGGLITGHLTRHSEPERAGWNAIAVWGFATTAITYVLVTTSDMVANTTLGAFRSFTNTSAAATGGAYPGGPGANPYVMGGGAAGAHAAAGMGYLGFLIWVPITLFITFGVSFYTAWMGGHRASRV